jgi:hypothetical protein
MPQYVIVAATVPAGVRYLYDSADKALKKARTLNNQGIAFHVEDETGAKLTMAALVAAAGQE